MSFDKAVLEVILLIPRGRFTAYMDVAIAAGSGDRYRDVGKIAREDASHISHRIVSRTGKKRFRVSPGFTVSQTGDDFRLAIDALRGEGIDVTDGGIISMSERYLDAAALTLLRVAAKSASSP